MKCPYCQTENREGAEFCRECGKPIESEIICPKCGLANLPGSKFCDKCGQALAEVTAKPMSSPPLPSSFVNGRYKVKSFLGEGGMKKVYFAHDSMLDRDVAFALIKTEGLDDAGKARITREAQALGKLGDHPNIVGIFDMGADKGQPYVVLPVMPGGDVQTLIEKAPEHRLPIEQAIRIAKDVCSGLEYAHSKGIVHRDLKPGNTWLSADGTAKIGDFGLAMTADLSRLTQTGMMVGTYYYIPPEQAMGGEVTFKSDLYSLGAMLYEMLAGRPPFIGDDAVAVIGQHINTQPVSPDWHNREVSPELAILCMELLEKDPKKRPVSAEAVRKVLEAIESKKVTRTLSPEKQDIKGSPIYRRVFVGREAELRQLESSFDTAMSGQGSLTMVVGEPGIGKTALCEQLATYVTLRGGKALVGHCYEEGSLSLPYLAFVEALRSYVLTRDANDLKKELGTGATDVARIVSEIREKVRVTPRAAGDPEEDRYRLLQSVTDFLGNAANIQPMLIIIEDMHDADRGTLEMLSYIARFLAGKRLMIIGTYRDIEVDRSHPLSAALAEFRRLPSFGRVLLRGLNADEVRRMLNSITGQEVPWGLAEAVHRQTEGNPLFVQEVIRYLVEEGLITRDKGQWKTAKDTPVEMQIPEGLRDVIGKRISSLSKECNRILSIASVIGREFRLDILKKVAAIPDEELFNALEEAKKAAVIEERSAVGAAITYRFAHAFFRQTLYEEIIAPRRIRLHQQVGRAIEEVYATRLEDHAAELAEHFSQSSESADLVKAVSYGEMAARRAVSVYAYAEAVRLVDQATRVQEILDSNDKEKRCDLLLFLCEVLSYAAEYRRVIDTEATQALKLAEEMGDSRRAAAACRFAMVALIYYGAGPSAATTEFASWVNKVNANAQPGTVEKAWADLGIGCTKILATGDYDEGIAALKRAVNLGRSLGNYEVFAWAAYLLYGNAMPPDSSADGVRVTEELMASPARSIIPHVCFSTAILTYLVAGKRKQIEEINREYQELARRRQEPYLMFMDTRHDVIMLAIDGRLEEAVEAGQKILVRGQELGVSGRAWNACRILSTMPVYFLGWTGEHLPGIEYPKEENTPQAWGHRALIQAHLGKHAEVIGIIEEHLMSPHKARVNFANAPYQWLMLWLEAAVLAGHYPAVELLFGWLKDTGYVTTGSAYLTCVPRHLGSAAALLGKYEEARKHYHKALEVTTQMKFRPELALTHLQAAELLLKHFPREKAEAMAHLNAAIPELRDMKMKPFLGRALKLKG